MLTDREEKIVRWLRSTAAVNLVLAVAREDVLTYLRRERAGSSASMNGGLDYTEPKMVEALADAIERGEHLKQEEPLDA